MSLMIETTPEMEARLREDAKRRGVDAETYTLRLLQRLYAPGSYPPVTDAERADWQRLLSFAGSVDSGDPHSADNERIDADLAREYGSNTRMPPDAAGHFRVIVLPGQA